MSCKIRQAYVDDVAKKFMAELKVSNKELGGPAIKAEAYRVAEEVVAKVEALSKEPITPDNTEAIKANATTAPKPRDADMERVAIPKDILALHDSYRGNASNDTMQAIINMETAYGFRNADGELLVKFKQPKVIGSSVNSVDEPITNDVFEDYYIDEDGSMSKSANINKAFIELDKKNQGANFDQKHSDILTNNLKKIESLVASINKTEVRIKKSTLLRGVEAIGGFNPETNDIDIRLDTDGPGAKFRTNFSMGNQEVYLHELTHAVMDFIFDPANMEVTKNPDVVSLVTSLKQLYTKALNNSDYKTLLPGYVDGVTGVVYTTTQVQQAKDKWDYVFKNKTEHGLHEFMAGLMTNSMFREGMETIGALDTNKIAKGDSIPTIIEKLFHNIVEKILGLATNKRDNSITTEGVALLFKIMKANYHATDRVSMHQAIKSAENVYAKAAEGMKYGNDKVAELVAPFIGVFDSLNETIEENKTNKILDDDAIAEFIKLKNKIDSIIKPRDTKPTRTGHFVTRTLLELYDTITDIMRFIIAMPAMYKMRKLVYGTKRSRDMAIHFAKTLNKMLESVGLVEEGAIRSFVRDFVDKPGIYNYLADSILKLTQTVDNVRQATYEQVVGETVKMFGEVKIDSDILNLKHNEALTDTLLRTEAQVLGLDAKGLAELLRDPSNVQSKIAEMSEGLSSRQLKDAKSMARGMVTGVGITGNEFTVAAGFGTGKVDMGVSKEVVEQVNKLITYMAIDITDADSKKALVDFMDGVGYKEYSGTLWRRAKKATGFQADRALSEDDYKKNVENGLNFFMDRAVGLRAASIEEMKGNTHKRIKGYIKETYNADNEVEFHPMKDKEQLIKDGYKFIRVGAMFAGSTMEYGMFTSNAPAIKRANGALGLQDKKSRGLTLSDIVARESANDTNAWDSSRKTEAFKKVLDKVKKDYLKDPTSTNMQPVYNTFGDIIDFRATMSIAEKREHLDMENRGTQVLARTYSTMGTADATANSNRNVVDLIHKDYKENYNSNPDGYIVIEPEGLTAEDYGLEGEPKSPNATKYERMWARLPSDTKAYAKEKFGGKKIIIKKELLTIAFGEDNFSIADVKWLEKLSPKTKKQIRVIESLWQDTMQIAKGNIVIKTPGVLIGNVMSNLKILVYVGVHPVIGVKLMVQAAKDLKLYEASKKELASLKRDKLSGKEINESRVKELENEIATNSVAPLIEAGLYQSIVEDVSTASDLNRVAKMFDSKVDKYITNETANSAVQYLFLTQKTKPYQQMLKATQVSDFYFRYAQYYDAIQNKKQSPAKAMREAIDNYINYEVPLEKHVRYMDSIGSWFFIKYFVKIQRVIKKFAKQHPLKMAIDIASQAFITGDTDGVENAWIGSEMFRRANPFNQFKNLGEVISPPGLDILR